MFRPMRPALCPLAVLFVLSPFVFAQGTPPAKPVAPAAPAAAAAAEKPEEIKLPGVVLDRPDGRFLSVETEGVKMKVTFYDREKKKEPADVLRISARWTDSQPRFAVLLPEAPETLVSPGVLKRPFNYIVYLALVGSDEKVKETHSLRLQ